MLLTSREIILILFTCQFCKLTTTETPTSPQYVVYQIIPPDENKLQKLNEYWVKYSSSAIDFWKAPTAVNRTVHVMVGPKTQPQFVHFLTENNIPNEVLIGDVQKLIEFRQKPKVRSSTLRRDPGIGPGFEIGRYHSYSEISNYMTSLTRHFPSFVNKISIGRTHEGRPLWVLKIGAPRLNGGGNKPAIWIDSGIHAREWISPAVAVYFINRLVTGYHGDPHVRQIVDNLDWYIAPVVNPDGYEYSRSSSNPEIRLWRKNRSLNRCQPGDFTCTCRGVDLNRNFNFHWGETGSSSDPCSEIYQGPAPFSEPETRAIRDFVLSKRNLQAFLTLHSYSQIWMYPYGHLRQTYPSDVRELRDVAMKATMALQRSFGKHYMVGTGADTLYPASGGSEDWSKAKGGVKYSFLLELPPQEQVWDGFLLNENQIIPTGKETWEGIKVVADHLMQRGGVGGGGGGIVRPLRPARRLVVDGAAACVDYHSSCSYWASRGRCRMPFPFNVSRRCPRSCEVCRTNIQFPPKKRRVAERSCRDTRSDCASWRRLKQCRYVKNTCKSTCGYC